MEQLGRHNSIAILIGFILVLCGCYITSCHQVKVCTPNNSTSLQACNDKEWIRIKSELYTLRPSESECQTVNLTCNNYVYDIGLLANCNGPVQQNELCEEEVDFNGQIDMKKCFNNQEMLATIEYECVSESIIINVCENQTLLLQSDAVHLVTPQFTRNEADIRNMMCTCSVESKNPKVEAVDLNVKAGLQWSNETNTSSLPKAVMEVTSDTQTLWSSNSPCQGCEYFQVRNEIMFLSDGTSSTIDVAFTDFGLQNQRAWIKMFDLGGNVNISCSSVPLPANRIITTTTTTTTTTPSTTSTTMTTAITSLSTTTQEESTISTVKTTNMHTTTGSSVIINRKTSNPLNKGSNDKKDSNNGGKTADDDSDDSSSTVIFLVVVLLILIGLAAVLAIFIYRKREKFATTDFTSPIWPWLKRCCRRHKNPYVEDEEYDDQFYSYDNETYGCQEVYAEPNAVKMQTFQSHPVKAGEQEIEESDEYDQSVDEDSLDTFEGRKNSNNSNNNNNDNLGNCFQDSLFNKEMDGIHQQIVKEEVARIKTERRKSKNVTATTDSIKDKDDGKRNRDDEEKHVVMKDVGKFDKKEFSKVSGNDVKGKESRDGRSKAVTISLDNTNEEIEGNVESIQSLESNNADAFHTSKKSQSLDKALPVVDSETEVKDMEKERNIKPLFSPEENRMFRVLGIGAGEVGNDDDSASC